MRMTQSDPTRYDVFISYARQDAALGAIRLDDALSPDFRVWRDTRGVDPAQDFTAEIEKAIQASAHMVVCVTPDVLRDNSFVRREISYAQILKKPILIARFADIIPPIQVVNNSWLDFFNGWQDALANLLGWLRGETVISTPPDSTRAPLSDPYKPYLETLYADLVESIRVSVFSDEAITLRAVESVGDVPRKTRHLNPKFLTYVAREPSSEPEPAPQTFDSLRDAYAQARCDGRILLLGEPGAGKTTTLLAFARDATAARLSDPSQPLPIFARIAGWDSRSETSLYHWLAQMYEGLEANALQKLHERGNALVLLDGLDELGRRRPADPHKPTGEQYDPRERFLMALPRVGTLILSSRVEEYREIGKTADLACAVRLQRLDDTQMREYLADVPSLWKIVAGDTDLKDALRTPLLLALVRVGFEEAPEELRALGGLDAGELNDRIWDAFIDKRWKHEQARTPDKPLSHTARELKKGLGWAIVNALSNWRDGYITINDLDRSGAEDFIALAEALDLIRPDGMVFAYIWNNPYRLIHLRLRDALGFSTAKAAVHSPLEHICNMAVEALGRLRDPRAIKILENFLSKPDNTIVHLNLVLEAIGVIGGNGAVKALSDVLHDLDLSEIHNVAASALELTNSPAAIEALIFALQYCDEDTRIISAELLGSLGDISAIEPLFNLLSDSSPNDYVHFVAAEALGRLGDTRAIQTLLNSLAPWDEEIESRSFSGLIGLGQAAVIPLVNYAAVSTIWDDELRDRCINAIAKIGESAVSPLIDCLRNPDRDICHIASEALVRLGEVATDQLIATLRHKATRTRKSAIKILGRIEDSRAIDPLIKALRDPDEGICSAALRALKHFTDDPDVQHNLANWYASRRKD